MFMATFRHHSRRLLVRQFGLAVKRNRLVSGRRPGSIPRFGSPFSSAAVGVCGHCLVAHCGYIFSCGSFVPHNERNAEVAVIAASFHAEIILVVTV